MSNTVRSAAVRLTMENASYLRGANQAATATEVATGRMKRSVRGAAVSTGRDWEAMGKYGGRYALAVGAGLAAVVKTTADFGAEMALVRTLSHANQGEMNALSKAALTVGKNIGYSAKEVASGEEEMIKAGISVKDILGGGLKGALDLAAAGQTDVATATTIAASAMTQFKLKGKDIPHVADLLAAGADKALGSVEDLGYALEQSGTTAHQMGLSIEQTVGTLAAFAQAGLIGERGGTTFKQMLLRLADPSKQASKLMDKYGLSLYDANGQIKTMPQLAGNLQQAFGKLNPAQRNAALGTIFGSRAIQGANILMADGRVEIAKWISKVNDQGFAAGQASGKLDSLSGDVKKFKSALSTTFIEAGSPSQQALRDLVQGADHLVTSFSQLPDEIQQGTVKLLALTAGVGGTLYAIAKVRKIASELGGFGRGKAGGSALGRAASIAAPVPVFVTNLGAGGLGAGGKGGTTVLGEGAAAGEGKLFGKIPLKAVGRGNLAVGLTAMVLEGLGFGKKWHAGSTLSLTGAGSFLGPLGTIGGAIIGGGVDIYHSGGGTKSALDRANAALASGNVKQMKAALVDLQNTATKLGTGGASQNFNRFVTEVTGRRKDIEQTGKALEEAINPKMRADTRASLDYLLTLGRKGHTVQPPKPDPAAFDTLLAPNRKGSRKPKPMTSEEVLAQLYGINPKKLKPINLLDQITGIADVFGTGKGPSKKAVAKSFAVSLGMNSAEFERKWKKAKHDAAVLNATKINPQVTVNTAQAEAQLGQFGAYLANLTRPRSVDVSVHLHKGSIGNGGSGGIGSLLTPADGVTVPGSRGVYGDRVPALLAPTEEVISNRHGQADRWRPLLKAINANRFAGGGTVPGNFVGSAVAAAQALVGRTGIIVQFPPPSALDAAVAAADQVAADAVKVTQSAKDIRQQNLDDLHTQQQIRDLEKQLHARNKKHKLELRGLDRKAAIAELADAKATLTEIRNQKKADLEEARQAAIEEQQQKRQDATDALSAAGDIFARGTSPSSAITSVNRAISDISTYGQVMGQLKSAGASPALLQQLINRAQQGDFRSAIRLGRALLAQPGTLSQLNASLSTLGTVSSSVATMTTDPRFLSAGAWSATPTNLVQVQLTADPSSWLLEVQRVVRVEVQNMLTGAIR